MSAAIALCPRPRPSTTPAAMAITFFIGAASEGVDRLWEAHLIRDVGLPDLFGLDFVVWFGLINVVGLLAGIVITSILIPRFEHAENTALARALMVLTAIVSVSVIVFGLAMGFAVALAAYMLARLARRITEPLWLTWLNRNIDRHSRAYATLLTDGGKQIARYMGIDGTQSDKCLACHATAHGKPGGYPDVGHEWTPEETAHAALLQGVTCEACHGPGSQYGPYKAEHEDYKRADLVAMGAAIPITAETCTPCHVKECPTMGEDYAFDPAAALEKAKAEGEGTHDHVALKHPH